MRVLVGLGILLGFFVVPLLLLGVQSVAGRWVTPDLVPGVWTLAGWAGLVDNPRWLVPWASSLAFSLGTWALASALCFPAARALAWSGRRSDLREAFLLAPAVVPALTTAPGNHLWMSWVGWTDSVGSLVAVLTFYTYPYLLRSLTAGYRLMGPDLARTGANLGATPWAVFWRLEFPLLVPAWLAGGSIVFLGAFSDFFLVSLFGGGVVPAFSTYLVPVLGGSDRTRGSVLTLVFLAGPLVMLGVLEGFTKAWMVRRGLVSGRAG